ncbi:MAG: hypothetical protein LBD35_03290 [Prevotellaceae bacterium]|jgi:hypothetical protein|nr:hypothetical protein [Prevotellaceae bacterium]
MTKTVFAILIALGSGASLRAQDLNLDLGLGYDFSQFWNMSYNYNFNPYLGAAGGVHFLHVRLKHYENGYDIDDHIYKPNGILSLNAYTPSFRKFGLFGGASFSFEILPFDFTEVRHVDTDKKYSRTRFSQFNPALWLNAGVSYNIEDVWYFSLGVIFSPHYDLYVGYRNLQVNGTQAGLPASRSNYWGLFLRFSSRGR